MLDIFGEPLDGLEALGDIERRPIHGRTLPLSRRQISLEIFETGIKAIDLLCPLERGGKARLFGGAGGGQDRATAARSAASGASSDS